MIAISSKSWPHPSFNSSVDDNYPFTSKDLTTPSLFAWLGRLLALRVFHHGASWIVARYYDFSQCTEMAFYLIAFLVSHTWSLHVVFALLRTKSHEFDFIFAQKILCADVFDLKRLVLLLSRTFFFSLQNLNRQAKALLFLLWLATSNDLRLYRIRTGAPKGYGSFTLQTCHSLPGVLKRCKMTCKGVAQEERTIRFRGCLHRSNQHG